MSRQGDFEFGNRRGREGPRESLPGDGGGAGYRHDGVGVVEIIVAWMSGAVSTVTWAEFAAPPRRDTSASRASLAWGFATVNTMSFPAGTPTRRAPRKIRDLTIFPIINVTPPAADPPEAGSEEVATANLPHGCALTELTSQGTTLHYTHQNIADLWNVMTRPLNRNALWI